MRLTYDQLDKEMGDWHDELQKKQTPVAPPTPLAVTSEIMHLTGDKARQFLRDHPRKIVIDEKSSNSNAQAAQ